MTYSPFSQRRHYSLDRFNHHGQDYRQDPDTPPIGRQPSTVQVAPSRDYPWYGSIVGATVAHGVTGPIALVGGERFTREQVAELSRLGMEPASVSFMLVKRQATPREMWQPSNHLPSVFAFECPIIGSRGAKIRVIAPSGTAKLVAADGWAHRPFRIARGTQGQPLLPSNAYPTGEAK